jgi:ribonuclease BN (tRNA processing enzyme)
MGLTLLPLGVGDAFASRYYSTSLALRAEGRWLLIDCPHPIRKMMREAELPLDVPDIDAVALTHLHGDHVSGLEGFAFFAHFVLRRRVPLIAHPEVAAPLWGHLAASMSHLIDPAGRPLPERGFVDYFDPLPLDETRAVQFGPFSIECRRTIHHIPTTALRIRAGGRCLGYSADTSFDPTLIAWLAEADLIVHETNYGAHTPYARLAELPEALRARMRLVHYPDDFDTEASVIEPLRQGRPIEV